MASIMTLTDAILDHIPQPATGWAVYRQTAPKPTDKPPWIIETVTTTGHMVGETQRIQGGIGTLQVRIVSTTADSVNVLADDLMIPAHRPTRRHSRFLDRMPDPRRRFRRVCGRFDRRGHQPALPVQAAHLSIHLEPQCVKTLRKTNHQPMRPRPCRPGPPSSRRSP